MLSRRVCRAVLRSPSAAARVVGAVRQNQQATADSGRFDPLDATRRRLVYRSKQRGWLEMDIMLGNWAAARLKDLGEEELVQFSHIIDMENPDLYKWLTGQAEVPAEVNNPLLRKLCAELKQEYGPKATVQSTKSFEGKVWE
mmetsp:Transcript_17296/g.52289  ORF Transcript_17296/g.52289 Transcript_17296/m.52289 type:complete len:142 (+) Transcript_17296:29-454(+)